MQNLINIVDNLESSQEQVIEWDTVGRQSGF